MDHRRNDVVELERYLPDIAIAAALAWGSGLRAYAVIFALGLAGTLGWLELPEHLRLLQHPLVFFADKLPWLAAGVHLAKTGTRATINASPEPFSNWTASLAEDALVPLGLWLAVVHPLLFFVLLALFLLGAVLLLRFIWRGLHRLFA